MKITGKSVAILFGDTKGFSKLKEPQLKKYLGAVIPKISKIISENSGLYSNTWGDGIVSFFEDPVAASRCALGIRDLFLKEDWQELSLPNDLNIRLSLHFAKIYIGKNEITGRDDVVGSQINLTARIEPIVEPGYVYCTSQLKSQLNATSETKITTDSIGEVELAKGWGKEEIFRVRWHYEPDTKPKVINESEVFKTLQTASDPVVNSIEILKMEGLSDAIIGNTIMTLGKSKDSRALKILGEVLTNSEKFTPNQRAAAAMALKSLGDNRAFEYLKEGVQDSIESIASYSIGSIVGLKDKRIVPILNKVCLDREEKSTDLRALALKGLIELDDSRSIEAFIKCIDNEPDIITSTAIKGLGSIKDKKSSEKLLEISLSKDRSQNERHNAILALGEMRDLSASDTLIDLLSDDQPMIQVSAIISLAKIRNFKAIDKLIEIYKNKENYPDYIGWGIIEKISAFDSTKVKSFLLPILDDPDHVIVEKAIDSLVELESYEALTKIQEIAKNKDLKLSTRTNAIDAIGKLGYSEGLSTLKELLASDNMDIVNHVLASLKKLDDLSSLKSIINIAVSKDKYPGKIRKAALNSIRSIADDSIQDEILTLLNDTYEPVINEAITILGMIGGAKATNSLLEILDKHIDYSPQITKQCILSLAMQQVFKGMDKIVSILLNESEIIEVKKASIYYLGCVRNETSTAILSNISSDNTILGGIAREALFMDSTDFYNKLFNDD